MSIFEALLLGLVQGISEFLPISSSGHLVLVRYYLGIGDSLPLYVGIATNTGTLLAVFLAFYKDVWQVLLGVWYGVRRFVLRQSVVVTSEIEEQRLEAWRLAGLVLLGSIPTAIIGFTTEPFFERLATPVPTACALIVTGFILWFAPQQGEKNTAYEVAWYIAIIIGILQGIAVMPGISRAGITIAGMLWLGVSSRLAARISFLMYLVVSLGVALLGIDDIAQANIELVPLLLLFLVSFVTGFAALQLLFRILRRGQLGRFAPYLWIISVLTLLHVFLTV